MSNGFVPSFAYGFMLLLASLSIQQAHASYEREFCETRLHAEFGKHPNDRELGKITENVPMTPDNLVAAIQRGIFPYYINNRGNPHWANPPERGVLLLDELHISRSDMEFIEATLHDPSYAVTIDQDFGGVIEGCMNVIRWRRLGNGDRVRDGQWITQEYVDNYTELFRRGLAHSVEVRHNGILVGGLYGTFIRGVFAGESMFHLEKNVNKVALYVLLRRLIANGHWFIDTQQSRNPIDPTQLTADELNELMRGSRSLTDKWGARPVKRDTFKDMLQRAQAEDRPF